MRARDRSPENRAATAARKQRIHVTETDFEKLQGLLRAADPKSRDRLHLRALEQELEQARVVSSAEVPGGVVTMNSTVRVRDLDSQQEIVLSLVFPKDADIGQNRISVLAPLGTALIGYKVGDTIEWVVPAGRKRLRVEEILYQPEAAGAGDR
ncbi:MAG: nucleoside diphosphate kinase regulator [bacterium]